jgi:hypothetical protein
MAVRHETRLRRLEGKAQAVAKHIIPWGKCPSDEKKAAAEAALIKGHGRNIEIIHVITGVRGRYDDDD